MVDVTAGRWVSSAALLVEMLDGWKAVGTVDSMADEKVVRRVGH